MLLLLAMTLANLGATERGEVAFTPTPAEAKVPEQFRLTAAVFPFSIAPRLDTRTYTVSEVRFPSPIITPEAENNTVPGQYFRPKRPGKRPAVVVLHILGADFALSRYLAARLADKGVAALFIELPYYGARRPAGEAEKQFLSADIGRSTLAMRQGVCDVRRASAWLASRPEVDAAKVGVIGISLGAIVGSVATAVDPAITRGAFLLAGGDLALILWGLPEGRRYRDAWVKAGKTFDDLKALTRPFDPLTHAKGLVGKKVFLMAGKVDEVIPPASARALWDAAGRPPIAWYDCGHYTAASFILPAIRQAVDFLAADAGP